MRTIHIQRRSGRAAVAGVLVLCICVVPLGAQLRMESNLSDAEFWRIFSTFSEPGGTFTTENFTSNELAVAQVASDLVNSTRSGGAYIGVGPEQNFTYIAAIEPNIAFIVDIRRQAAIQHLLFKAVFELSETRAQFIERLFSRSPKGGAAPGRDASVHDIWLSYLTVPADPSRVSQNFEAIRNHLVVTHKFALSEEDLASLARVYDAFVKTGPAINYLTGLAAAAAAPFRSANFASLTMSVDSAGVSRTFLGSHENFALVKDMHQRNMIVPIVGDFAGPKALQSIASFLRERGNIVTAFYVSNVEQYLFRPVNKSASFYHNVASLPLDSMSVLIRPGAAGSTPLRSAPFNTESTDSVAKLFVDQFRKSVLSERPPAALCPALQFLKAVNAGRVNAAADAELCVKG